MSLSVSRKLPALTLAILMLAASLSIVPPVVQARSLSSFGSNNNFYPDLVADVAEAVAPSVVNIDTEETRPITQRSLPFNEDVLRYFFGGDGNTAPFQQFGPQEQTISGNGSGMILNKDGFILTNNHVVANATRMTVTLKDGRQFPARLIGRDSYTDVAVIKIDAPSLIPVVLGNSDTLRPGEWAIAVGSPLGFDHTVTLGIISALSRRIPDLNANLSFIQTDAAINPGNSGGPLLNLKGEVVGINTAISGKGQNIGFATPINLVKTIADTLITGGTVVRPWIGVSMIPLNPELAKHIGVPPTTQGVVVAQVLANSPAAEAGLKQGDVIQRVDAHPIRQAEDVQEVVRQKPINSPFIFDVFRNGRVVPVTLNSAQLPPDVMQGQVPLRPRVSPRQ